MIQQLVCLCVLVMAVLSERKEIVVQFTATDYERNVFEQYFHRIRQGYFLELGGYNPIYLSNGIALSNWKGLIVQADQSRANIIRDYQPSGVTALNFALSDVSGQIVTLYQKNDIVGASISKAAIGDDKNIIRESQTITISLADLCHKYYRMKPITMSIDVEGIGQNVLKSNDWKNPKCIPDWIWAQDSGVNINAGQPNIGKYLQTVNYTLIKKFGIDTLFIHKSKLQFYQKEAEANKQFLAKPRIVVAWQRFLEDFLSKLIGPFGAPEYKPRTAPAYVQIRQHDVLNIVEINNHSNSISDVGFNRPIVILEYDQKFSSIYLGTKDYNISEVAINDFLFKKITSRQVDRELLVYVLDHQKHETFNLVILDSLNIESTTPSMSELQKKISYVIIVTLVLTNALLLGLYALYRQFRKKKSIKTGSNGSNGSISNQLDFQQMIPQEKP